MIKNNKGLTLVNLIATLVLMLIITYITVSLVVGDEGVISEADNIKNQSEIEDIKEKIYLSVIKNTAENGDIDIDAIKSEVENGDIKNILLDGSKIKFEYNGMGYEVDVNDVSDTVKAGYNNSSTPNAPYLMSGMEPVKWVVNEEGVEEPVKTNENDKEWYNYDEQKWANAITVEDGSYWVWIPRYEYKITYYTDDTKTELSPNNAKTLFGKIDVNFIPKEKTIPTDGYKIHPAFTDGTDNYFDNGEWDKEVSGIWVSKYTISCEEYVNNNWNLKKFSGQGAGDIPISDTIRAVSKKRSTVGESWRQISIGMAYKNSYNYDREKESHLIKNSEYGALTYLIYSKFGTNMIAVNTGGEYTGNITGIFAMNGDTFYTAGYLADGNEFAKNANSNIDFFIPNKYNTEKKDIKSTKYMTRYPADSSENSSISNFEYYEEFDERRYGDAITEVNSKYNTNYIRTFELKTSTGITRNFSSVYPHYYTSNSTTTINKIFVRQIFTLFRFDDSMGNAAGFSYNIVLIGE